MDKSDNKRMGKNLYKIVAIFVVSLLLGSVLVVSMTSADAATSPTNTVSKNSAGKVLVTDPSGRTVFSSYDSKTAIQAAIDRTSTGGTVLIKAGEYSLTGYLNAKAGTTLLGVGDNTILNNGEIRISASNVVLASMRMVGTCHVIITPTTTSISNIVVKDVSAKVGAIESAFSVYSNNYQVSKVQFLRDTVTDSASAGFILSGKAPISDVTIESCKALRLGLSARYNDWVTGFVLAQNAEVRNLKVLKCEASENWESGFFLKPTTTKVNVVLQDNIANSNGQKPLFKEGYGYLVDSTVSMVNCTGTGNRGGLTNLATPTPEPKSASVLAFSDVSSSVQTGTNSHASGTLKSASSSAIPGATVSLKVTLPDGTTANPVQGAQTVTDASGAFSIDFVPSVAGTHTFVATYTGSEAFNGTTRSASFSATAPVPSKTPSSMTLAPAASSVETNKNMRANGALTGAIGIAGATVSLKVTLPDGTTANPVQGATVVTDSSGKFVVDYVPTKVGTYKFTATFAGDAKYAGSSVTASFNAVAPAPVPTGSYDYIISNNVVKTSTGSTAYTGSTFTAALQWAMSQGGKVTYVPAGSYTITARINVVGGSVASPTTLVGDGDGTTGTVFTFTTNSESASEFYMYNTNNVVMKKFRIVSGAIEMRVSGTTAGNYRFEDVTLYRTNLYQQSSKHEASFQMTAISNGVMSGVSYYRCDVIEGGAVGFEPYGDFTGLVKNCYYEDCLASNIGLDSATRFNEWVVGFDIAESANVDSVTYVRCTAEYIFESGFHSEPRTVTNVLIKDSIAHHCGMKPENFVNSEGLPPGPYFGNGFFAPHNSAIFKNVWVTLQNCQGWANANGDVYGGGNLPPTG